MPDKAPVGKATGEQKATVEQALLKLDKIKKYIDETKNKNAELSSLLDKIKEIDLPDQAGGFNENITDTYKTIKPEFNNEQMGGELNNTTNNILLKYYKI
jgi:hypothetical protein